MAYLLAIDLRVPRRVPYAESFSFLEIDWTGSTFEAQVRLVKDTTNTPLIDLVSPSGISLAYAGTATVAAHVAASRLPGSGSDSIYGVTNPATGNAYQPTDNLTLSQVAFGINTSTIAAVPISGPPNGETGDDVECWYDVIRTPASGNAEQIMRGKFIVLAGVTI